MAAAPQRGSMTFRSLDGKRGASIDVYISDVVGGSVNFDSGAGAGPNSETFYTFMEAMVLTDFSILTGLTDTTVIRIVGSGVPTLFTLRYANHLNTLNSRPIPGVIVNAGSRLSATQLA